MKIIQLNAWNFRYLDELIDFLKQEKPDLINFQEISTGKFATCDPAIVEPFETIKTALGLSGKYYPTCGFIDDSGVISYSGNGFLTNLEIFDHGCFFETIIPKFTIFKESDDIIQTWLKNDKSKYYSVFEKPQNYVWAVLKEGENIFRNLTTHFTVSYGCKETLQIINQTRSVLEYLKNVKEMPTIFTGDLNIHDQSWSVNEISKHLDMVNINVHNTLNAEIHPIFKNEPGSKGVKVDYIFQKGFEVLSCSCPTITVTDHLPVIAQLKFDNQFLN